MSGKKVAVKKSAQSVFTRAVKNIKKRKNFIQLDNSKNDAQPKVQKPVPVQTEDESRGVVYLSHIPPGFFENEMRKYFNQFGHVTRIKLARSKKTGKSKGYAFIEFRYAEVAKVVAETMNNYLMCSRLLKAVFMDKKYSGNFWKPINPNNCPAMINRRRDIMIKNSLISPAKELEFAKAKKKKLNNLLEKLRAKGINYDFQPTDDISSEIPASGPAGKFSSIDDQTPESSNFPVFEVDESDDEINFKTPPNVIKRILKRKESPVEGITPKIKKSRRGGSSKKRQPESNSNTPEALNKKDKHPVSRGMANILKTPNKKVEHSGVKNKTRKTRIPLLKARVGNEKVKSKIPVVKASKKKV